MAGSECRGGSQKPGRIEKGAGPARPVRKLTGHKSSDKVLEFTWEHSEMIPGQTLSKMRIGWACGMEKNELLSQEDTWV